MPPGSLVSFAEIQLFGSDLVHIVGAERGSDPVLYGHAPEQTIKTLAGLNNWARTVADEVSSLIEIPEDTEAQPTKSLTLEPFTREKPDHVSAAMLVIQEAVGTITTVTSVIVELDEGIVLPDAPQSSVDIQKEALYSTLRVELYPSLGAMADAVYDDSAERGVSRVCRLTTMTDAQRARQQLERVLPEVFLDN